MIKGCRNNVWAKVPNTIHLKFYTSDVDAFRLILNWTHSTKWKGKREKKNKKNITRKLKNGCCV